MSSSPYDDLAEIYDLIQKDIDAGHWARYIDGLVHMFGPARGDGEGGRLLLCDLGCGTAGVALEMQSLGYDVIGIDESVLMLEKAREKAAAAGKNILFLCQDITDMELFGTVDVFTCLLDTVNHITRKADLQRMLSLFKNYLNPGGLFIFDTATPHHLRETLGNNFFYTIDEDFALLWENSFSPRMKTSTSDLTLFRQGEGNMYRRYEGRIRERIYTEEELRECLAAAGMELIGKYGELIYEQPEAESAREFYVARRPAGDAVCVSQ